jgi:predicted RNA-binding Zn-ribbon protein involved in translation (DUF1610 family)
MSNETTSGRLSCAACGGIVVTTSRGFDCPRCSGPIVEQRAREIANELVNQGIALALGARTWRTAESDAAREYRDSLTAELVALIKGGN